MDPEKDALKKGFLKSHFYLFYLKEIIQIKNQNLHNYFLYE